jgi:cytoskeletal protein RodZ
MTDLAAWRKRKGISMAAIAAATKISVRYLEAIEAGNFRALPGGAYSISYLRQYARAIHYDADDLVEHYQRLTAPAPAPALPPARRSRLSRAWSRLRSLRTISWHGGIPHPPD